MVFILGDKEAPAKAVYEKMVPTRAPRLYWARVYSEISDPDVMPWPDIHEEARDAPFHGETAEGVGGLSSKLALAMWPTNSSGLPLQTDPVAIRDLAIVQAQMDQEGNKSAASLLAQAENEIYESLARYQEKLHVIIEDEEIRTAYEEAERHSIVTGGPYLFRDPVVKKWRTYGLDQFCHRLDGLGRLIRCVFRETFPESTLDEPMQEALAIARDRGNVARAAVNAEDTEIEVFTCIDRLGPEARYDTWQEIGGVEIDGSGVEYPEDKLPWIYLPFHRRSGKSYAQARVGKFYGPSASLEGLAEILTEGSGIAAKTITTVDPDGRTQLFDVENADNGDIIPGREQDVHVLRAEKGDDYATAFELYKLTAEIVNRAFLQYVRRPGDRVTAEENRIWYRELFLGLGGIFTMRMQTIRPRMMNLLMDELEDQGMPIPKGRDGRPLILAQPATGIEEIARADEFDNMNQFLGVGLKVYPDLGTTYVDGRELLSVLGRATNVNVGRFLRSRVDIEKARQQAMTAGLVQRGLPNAINQAGAAFREQAAPSAETAGATQ